MSVCMCIYIYGFSRAQPRPTSPGRTQPQTNIGDLGDTAGAWQRHHGPRRRGRGPPGHVRCAAGPPRPVARRSSGSPDPTVQCLDQCSFIEPQPPIMFVPRLGIALKLWPVFRPPRMLPWCEGNEGVHLIGVDGAEEKFSQQLGSRPFFLRGVPPGGMTACRNLSD